MSWQAAASSLSNGIFLVVVLGIPLFAWYKRVAVYESFIDGAKDGFNVIVTIIPYLVAMLVAIGMFRASGALDLMAKALAPLLSAIGMPADVLPLALVRPFSGSAANGVMAELIQRFGGDHFISQLAATMMGGTETTFYVIAVYFGAVNIKRTRHAVAAGLLADLAGVIAAVVVCRLVLL